MWIALNTFMKTLWSFFLIALLGVSFDVSATVCAEVGRAPAIGNISSLMEVVEVEKTESKLHFSGPINKYSINRLIKRLDKSIKKNQGTDQEIILTLDSGGGDINQTIRAVRYIRELSKNPLIKIHTQVNSYNDCESACTILFTAGVKRMASERSRFGFHSPKYESGKLNGISRREVEERYRQIWLRYVAMVDQTTATEIESRGYLRDSNMSYISGRNLNTGYVTDLL